MAIAPPQHARSQQRKARFTERIAARMKMRQPSAPSTDIRRRTDATAAARYGPLVTRPKQDRYAMFTSGFPHTRGNGPR